MSNLYQRKLSLAGINVANWSEAELQELVRGILEQKIHGLSFSPYVEGQGPGTKVGEDQIRERLAIIAPYTKWIRTFSCTDGNERIPAIAREFGLRTMVGAWLDGDLEKNEVELANAIGIAGAGHADILGIGNEVLLRGELTEDQLIAYLERAKAAVPETDVGYVDAYFEFEDHPRLAAACDVILANCYPFWEGCPAEYALLHEGDVPACGARRRRQAGGRERDRLAEYRHGDGRRGALAGERRQVLHRYLPLGRGRRHRSLLVLQLRRGLESRLGRRRRRLLGPVGQGREPQVCLTD